MLIGQRGLELDELAIDDERIDIVRLETRLDPKKFVWIHRAHIVNMDRVVAFRRQDRGKLVAEMSDGTRLPVSRERAKEIREAGV